MYSASTDGTVRLWDIKEGTLVKTFTIGAPIKSMVRPAAQLSCKPGLFQVSQVRLPNESEVQMRCRLCHRWACMPLCQSHILVGKNMAVY